MREKLELVTKEEKVFGRKITVIGILVMAFSLIFLVLSSQNPENMAKDLLLTIEMAEKEISEPWIKEAKEITFSLLSLLKEHKASSREAISADIKTLTGIVFSAIENYRRLRKILQEYEMFIERVKKDLKAEEKTSAFFHYSCGNEEFLLI